MAVNEVTVTGRKFRKLVDEATKLWQRISFWTKASDVEFDDGSTAETKMGAINGITDSLVSTSSNVAASAKALSELNNKLNGCSLEQDGEDFYIVGADAVRKKLCNNDIYIRTRIIRPTEAWRIIDLCLDVSYDGATWNNLFTERLQVGTDGGTAYGFSRSIKYTVTAN